ncbi:hypothetical protein RclHR1_28590001 [Rhizophagus clarus]|uniref:Zinc-ribbon domain-containing protein n=1 Tax=Rhizophagus clarus TaxID=94130 RepID=A0A2Z6RFR8_9GLOM|nr:hypothetical protein RclHR1_28590001 [Rhizophagus clarus]
MPKKLTLDIARKIAKKHNGECLSTDPRKTIDNMCQHARSWKGDCLSDKYYNSDTKLKWICEKSHIWEARSEDVLRGTWCSVCTGNTQLTLEDMCTLAQKKDGGCLSDKYFNNSTKLKWICKNNHIWKAVSAKLDILYYGYGFAIKVQGEQHEKFNKFFYKGDPNNFIKQQAWDQLKKELCEENQIALRYVWYYEDPYVVILEHLQELGLIE